MGCSTGTESRRKIRDLQLETSQKNEDHDELLREYRKLQLECRDLEADVKHENKKFTKQRDKFLYLKSNKIRLEVY